MALTLDSIYKPINDFFLNLYKTDEDSPVFFKFDQFGSSQDFSDPNNPNSDVVLERFSDLVNRLPIEQDDDVNIIFSGNLLDDTYFYQILNASIPFAKDTDPNKEEIINAVSKIIADAKMEFDKSSLARQGMPSYFRASYANPEQWYNKSNTDDWTSHVFNASETTESLVKDSPKSQLWKLKLNDTVLKQILPVNEVEPVKANDLFNHVVLMKTNPNFLKVATATTTINPANLALKTSFNRRIDKTVELKNLKANRFGSENIDHQTVLPIKENFTLQDNIKQTVATLDLKQRYYVNRFIKENAPTQPATTDKISISFDYCKVDIRRPWLFSTLFHNRSWFVPNTKKGELSASDTGGNISLLPIGFVAIKNLSIEANWSDLDKTNSKTATDFGPFEVDSEIVNNKLSHEGIQIIGWVLQKMPDLPPNDAPL